MDILGTWPEDVQFDRGDIDENDFWLGPHATNGLFQFPDTNCTFSDAVEMELEANASGVAGPELFNSPFRYIHHFTSEPSSDLPSPFSTHILAGQCGGVPGSQRPGHALGHDWQQQESLAAVPNKTEYSQEEAHQCYICAQCKKAFEGLQTLDKHAKADAHKAWKCLEPGCAKAYVRRDTFLRHRAAHTDSGHACDICSKQSKHKWFKRKDHLSEHVRKCHSEGASRFVRRVSKPEGRDLRVRRSGSSDSSFDDIVTQISAEAESECALPRTPLGSTPGFPSQQQAMKDLVRSLGTVLGDSKSELFGKLGDKMITLSESDMKSVAESMAGAAIGKTLLSKSC